MTVLLETRGLGRSFAGVAALVDVDLSVHVGEVHAIAGANGAGKSTLIKILSGALRPSAGSVHVDGHAMRFDNPRQAQRAGIVAVYQELSLVPELSVAQNIFLGREPVGRWGLIDRGRMNRDAATLIDRIGFDIDPLAVVANLRVADQQLVEIARALSLDSRLVILDEPTAVLSLPERNKLFAIIDGLRRDGVAVLYISHRLDEIFALSQRVSVFRDGRLVSTADTAAVTETDVVRQMIGGEVDALRRIGGGRQRADRPGQRENSRVLLEVTQSSGAVMRTFTIEAGEIVGVAGFVGSGRSSLGRAIAGISRQGGTQRPGVGARAPISLDIRLDGRAIDGASPADASARAIVYLTEDRKRDGLFRPLSILANTSAASLHRISSGGFIRFARERELCESFLTRMRLKAASLRSGVHQLSGGNQQKVVFARGLLQQPKVLICDEPTRGVDVGAKREIHQLLIALAEQGVGILVISSEFAELRVLCDRFLVMSAGVIVADLSADEASEERLLAIASGVGDGGRPETPIRSPRTRTDPRTNPTTH